MKWDKQRVWRIETTNEPKQVVQWMSNWKKIEQ
jgi:hypothetical protein